MVEFEMGVKASCSDGFCGEVRRTILDPATRTVTHLVIEPKHDKAEGRLVPLELVDATGPEIRLHCTLAEFERLWRGRLDRIGDVLARPEEGDRP